MRATTIFKKYLESEENEKEFSKKKEASSMLSPDSLLFCNLI